LHIIGQANTSSLEFKQVTAVSLLRSVLLAEIVQELQSIHHPLSSQWEKKNWGRDRERKKRERERQMAPKSQQFLRLCSPIY